MTSPGSIIVAHTRTFHSEARVGNREIFEPPKKIETEKVLYLLRMHKSSLGKERRGRRRRRKERNRRREGEREREDGSVVIAAKETVLLSLMRKNSENNNTHTHTHTQTHITHQQEIDRKKISKEQTNEESFSFSACSSPCASWFLSRGPSIIKSPQELTLF